MVKCFQKQQKQFIENFFLAFLNGDQISKEPKKESRIRQYKSRILSRENLSLRMRKAASFIRKINQGKKYVEEQLLDVFI